MIRRYLLHILLSILTSYGTCAYAGFCDEYLSGLLGFDAIGQAVDSVRYKAGINNLYRGIAGPLILQRRSGANAGTQIAKIEDKILQYTRRETDREYIAEVGVLGVLLNQAKRGYSDVSALEANFSVIYQFSKSWAETARYSRQFGYYAVHGLGHLDDLKDIGFVLRVTPPPGTRYWDDRNGDINSGVMTRLNAREVIPYERRNQIIYRVFYKGEWQNPEPIRGIWEPLNEFAQDTVEMMFNHPEGTVEEWVMEMRQIYKRIFARDAYQK